MPEIGNKKKEKRPVAELDMVVYGVCSPQHLGGRPRQEPV